jgi:hypothetical protein
MSRPSNSVCYLSSQGMMQAPWEGFMTTTKIAYLIAVVVPFGFIVLAAVFLLRTAWLRHKASQVQPHFN